MMRQAIQLNPEVQSLASIHEAVARAQAVLKGDFKKEIESMRALQIDLKERQGAIDTVEKANQVRVEADRYSSDVRSQADAALARATATNAQAEAKLSGVMDREAVLERGKQGLEKSISEHQERVRADIEAQNLRRSELQKREAACAQKEQQLNDRERKLKEKEKSMQSLLVSLGS